MKALVLLLIMFAGCASQPQRANILGTCWNIGKQVYQVVDQDDTNFLLKGVVTGDLLMGKWTNSKGRANQVSCRLYSRYVKESQ